jgi:hypothetical protein
MRSTLLATALLLAGCVPPRAPLWVPSQPAFVAEGAGYEVVPPPGWMRLDAPMEPDVLVLTRDGTQLQRIVVASTEVGKPLDMGGGKRVVTAGMSTHELAELLVDDVRAMEGITELQVLENAPATLAGRDGFRVVVAFRDVSGLRRRVAFLGVVEASRFYRLMYTAAERHYFAADLPVFEEVARSLRLRPPAPAQARAQARR